ncbi:MAG TPA: T9SS type A sorting domain-containing protein, partial [Bacteroidetes bacterium]|nr:T9SS type A sorting domain-containing protein [Bacteroidota bacterium]
NTWYHLEFKNIDFVAKTYDIWLDGTLVRAGHAFRSQSSTNISTMFLYNFSGSGTAYYDDINVGGVSLNLSTMPTDVLCAGDSTGTATVNSSGGTPPYTYAWSSGATNQLATGLMPGGYAVTVTDSLGCVGSDSATVGSPPAILSSSASIDARCNGDSTGSIDLTVSGGVAPYTFSWSNGSTMEDQMNLPVGTYAVSIIDSNGCTSSDTALIAEPTALTLTAVVTSLACFGDSSGSIDVTPTGGTPGYNYTWNNAATTQDLTNLVGGTYTIFVADSNGCSTGDIYTILEPTQLISSGVTTPDNGTNNGAIDLTTIGGTMPYTFSWSNGATTEDISGLVGGNYTVTITDSNGCIWTNMFTVSLIIGLDQGLSAPRLEVVPNPTSGTVRVTVALPATGKVQFSLNDLRGRQIFAAEQQANDLQIEQEIDLSNLPAGVYLLQVESEGQRSWTRIVRQ